MKDKIKNIAEKLEHQIRMHELDLNDRIKDIPQIILLLEQASSFRISVLLGIFPLPKRRYGPTLCKLLHKVGYVSNFIM